jgi:S1-C subfamily serine protease
MRRLWLLFAQTVTVLVAVWFVLVTLKPEWLNRRPALVGGPLLEAPAVAPGSLAPGSLSLAARKASPAVVSNTSKAPDRSAQQNDPWFRFFFGERDEGPQVGLGSGVIVNAEGFILTNNHVVEGADDIEVILNDRRRTRAKVIGTDPDTDLAVLKISLDRLPVIVWGASDSLQVGDQVLAIGNPFGVGQTVTSGIVSALGRSQLGINTFENFIQTDAAINPGNSGGALVDVQGHLLGINTAIYSRSGGSMGIGFAIPVSTARQVLEGLVRDGQVTRGWIGVEPREWTPELTRFQSRHPARRCAVASRRPIRDASGRIAQRGRGAQAGHHRHVQGAATTATAEPAGDAGATAAPQNFARGPLTWSPESSSCKPVTPCCSPSVSKTTARMACRSKGVRMFGMWSPGLRPAWR